MSQLCRGLHPSGHVAHGWHARAWRGPTAVSQRGAGRTGPISLPVELGENGVPSATLGNGPQTSKGFCSKSTFCHTIGWPSLLPS